MILPMAGTARACLLITRFNTAQTLTPLNRTRRGGISAHTASSRPPSRASTLRSSDVRRSRWLNTTDLTIGVTNDLLPGMAILNSRSTNIEKYQYLSVLRNTNVHLFYRLLSSHIKVRIIPYRSKSFRRRTFRKRSDKRDHTGDHPTHLHSHCWRGLSTMVRAVHAARG